MAGTRVTPETYIRAETDRQFGNVVKMAGGVNRLFLFRSPTPLDQQNIVRMNRDTLYSMSVVDTSGGAPPSQSRNSRKVATRRCISWTTTTIAPS